MATVRIYKVAQDLGISSQKVVELLKRDHGIEVKGASSTIEEVVAQQFIKRVGKELETTPPSGTTTKKTSARRTRGKKVATKSQEPTKPAVPKLGPPRLVKVAKPAALLPDSKQTGINVDTQTSESVSQIVAETGSHEQQTPSERGNVVSTTTRLRVENAQGESQPSAPAPKLPRHVRLQKPPESVRPPITRPTPPAPPRITVPSPLGGPRPLPSQPIRPPTPPRPGMPPSRPFYRPGGPGRRPPHRRRSHVRRESRATVQAPPVVLPEVTRTITLAEGMTVKDLADRLEVRAKDVMKKLLDKRLMMTINTTLDISTATTVAREFGADVTIRTFEEEILAVESDNILPEDTVSRAPIVTVMGHVDHGKTTLLDAIRKTHVAEREAGGITQHIGAYTVEINDRRVIFLDTPGHEAFTMMRARGASVTDIVILVVAADDGVMPQTKEAIDHSRAADVPLIIAINKIDKPDANPERVKKELSDLGLTPEEWGGQTVTVEISAKNKQNLKLLLEMILLVTELGELKANPKRNASGTVLEAKLDRGRGPVATILVQDGTLHVGDTFIAGSVAGRVRALIDDSGQPTKNAGPSTPVEVLGLTGIPQPGDTFQALTDVAKARQIAVFRQTQAKEKALGGKGARFTLESLQEQIAEGAIKELPLVIKTDVQGSAEVIADTLNKVSDDRVKIRIVHSGVGAINESDVLLASASNAIIIGFNVRPDRNAHEISERERIEIRQHSVIYKITEEVKKAMVGLLEPTFKEVQIGLAEVRQTFKVPKFGSAAGCMVTDGRITRSGNVHVRLLRDHIVIHEGKIGSLRRFKEDLNEVKVGLECGIAFERFSDIKPGDIIEAFTVEREPVKF